MAPEVARDEFYDTRADIFSFGLTVLACVEKEDPYIDLERQEAARMLGKFGRRFRNTKLLSKELREFITLATEFNPAQRFTAEWLLEVFCCYCNAFI